MKLSEIERWYILSRRRVVNGTDREIRNLSDLDLGLMHCATDADGQPNTLTEFTANVDAWFKSVGLDVDLGQGSPQTRKREPQVIEVALKDTDDVEERAGALLSCMVQPKVVGKQPPPGARVIQMASVSQQREA